MLTEHDDGLWFRPIWKDKSAEDGFGPSGLPRGNRLTVVPGLDAPALLAFPAGASAALARLEAADPAVSEGLRARLALREAPG